MTRLLLLLFALPMVMIAAPNANYQRELDKKSGPRMGGGPPWWPVWVFGIALILLTVVFTLTAKCQIVTWPFSVTECAGSILPPCDTLAACLEPVNSGLNGSTFAGATCYSNGAVINGMATFSVWSATPVTVDVAWGSDDLFSLSPPTPYELEGSVTFTITGQGTIHWVAAYALPMGINEHSPRSTGSGLPFDVLGRQLKTNQSE